MVESMNKDLKAYIIERECCICGELFEVRIDWDTDKVETKCFYGGVIRRGIGMYPIYRWDKNKDGSNKFTRITPLWKVLWYKIVDFKRLLLHQYIEVEYWECPKCLKEIKDKYE